MKIKRPYHIIVLAVSLAIFLNACGNNNAPTAIAAVTEAPTLAAPTITNTPDPCAPENIKAEAQKVHKFMREFDDAASLASSIIQGVSKGRVQMNELSNLIPNLQRIRREAEDQPIPACLVNLKTIQISHMYAVLNSLNAFLAGDQQTFDQNMFLARQQHDQYVLEWARLLGQTVVPIDTVIPSASATPNP